MSSRRSDAPAHPSLLVKRRGKNYVKPRTTYELVGCGAGHNYRAYNNTVDAMERAIKERLLFYRDSGGDYCETPLPNRDAFNSEAAYFLKLFRRRATYSHPLGLDEFVQCFNGQKKERYQRAAENLIHYGNMPKKGRLKFFLKYETYNFTLKPDAKPRGINPRSDEFIVDYGRRIKAIEKKIYQVLAELFGYKIVFKGLNQHSRGSLLEQYWKEFKDPVAIAADASAFEASVSSDALSFSHQIYNMFVRNDKEFKSMQLSQIYNKGSARSQDGQISFSFKGKRSSGDPDTALGNCLLSAYMMHKFYKEIGVKKHRGCIDGDDVVFIVERGDLSKIVELGQDFYLRHGFRMIFEDPVSDLEKIGFCQSSPIWLPSGYTMVRNPKSATSKDAISRKDLSSRKNYERWIASVGSCGLSCNGGVPIMQEYYQQFIRNSNGASIFEKEKLLEDYRSFKVQGMNLNYQAVHPYTRYSFYIAFGVTPDLQEAIEEYYANLTLYHGLPESLISPTPDLPW